MTSNYLIFVFVDLNLARKSFYFPQDTYAQLELMSPGTGGAAVAKFMISIVGTTQKNLPLGVHSNFKSG